LTILLSGIYFAGRWHHNRYFCRHDSGRLGLIGHMLEFGFQAPGGFEHLGKFGLAVELLLQLSDQFSKSFHGTS
jgi:hypothetical protein